ncbi:hypothetical protein BvCmsD80A_01555 [Escherichia coli]|nr:DUF1737 domain-containing protein [Escherichia coli]GCL13890.1 hypothetical protein BvCmsD80A_01555 [Escherichia coli]
MASELRSVTATTAHALKQKIMEYITEGWQPYGRILNAGALT